MIHDSCTKKNSDWHQCFSDLSDLKFSPWLSLIKYILGRIYLYMYSSAWKHCNFRRGFTAGWTRHDIKVRLGYGKAACTLAFLPRPLHASLTQFSCRMDAAQYKSVAWIREGCMHGEVSLHSCRVHCTRLRHSFPAYRRLNIFKRYCSSAVLSKCTTGWWGPKFFSLISPNYVIISLYCSLIVRVHGVFLV